MTAQPRFFGTLPERGIWTTVGLTRTQFVGLVLVSSMLFVAIGGPLWQQLHSSHLERIVWSYAAIPLLAAIALKHNGELTAGQLVGATLLVSMIKLVLTAAILIAVQALR